MIDVNSKLEQLSFDFGYNPQCDKYIEGYNLGLEWDANWMPGGPNAYAGTYGVMTPEKIEKAKRSLFECEQWHEGFEHGLKQRLATNEHFAAWWAKHGSGRSSIIARYTAPETVES